MTADDDKILEVLTGSKPSAADDRIREALNGTEYLYGLPEPEHGVDDAVRAWAAKESLKGACERFMRTGTTSAPETLERTEAIVAEAWAATPEHWSTVERMERTATVVNSFAASLERVREGKAGTKHTSIREAGR